MIAPDPQLSGNEMDQSKQWSRLEALGLAAATGLAFATSIGVLAGFSLGQSDSQQQGWVRVCVWGPAILIGLWLYGQLRRGPREHLVTVASWVVASWAALILLAGSSAIIGVILFKIFGSP
jgi:hypothetical protein